MRMTKDLEGSIRSLLEVVSRCFPGATEGNQEEPQSL